MKLFTKAIEKKAQEQFHLGSDMEKQIVVANFFNSTGIGNWYLMNQDPQDENYLWGLVDLFEIGSFSKSELENYVGHYGLGIERDLYFKEVNAKLWFKKTIKLYCTARAKKTYRVL